MSSIGWAVGSGGWSAPFALVSDSSGGTEDLSSPRFGVIDSYSTVEFSYVWTPITPGQVVDGYIADYGSTFGLVLDKPLDWPGYTAGPFGTATISAIIDGQPSTHKLLFVISLDYDWYHTKTISFEVAGTQLFWTNKVGTQET